MLQTLQDVFYVTYYRKMMSWFYNVSCSDLHPVGPHVTCSMMLVGYLTSGVQRAFRSSVRDVSEGV